MEKLKLNPPLLIITMGYPGAGKSFFSRQFSESFKLPCVSEDRIRFELFENPSYNNDEREIISRVLDYSIEQLMKTGSTILCDGDYSAKTSRERLHKLAHLNGYRTLIVWLQTDVNTSAYRALNRDRRNPDSKFTLPINQNTFKKLSAELTKPNDKENSIVISGKHAFKAQSLTVLRKITEIYANGLSNNQYSSPKNNLPTRNTTKRRYLVQ